MGESLAVEQMEDVGLITQFVVKLFKSLISCQAIFPPFGILWEAAAAATVLEQPGCLVIPEAIFGPALLYHYVLQLFHSYFSTLDCFVLTLGLSRRVDMANQRIGKPEVLIRL